MFIVPNPLSSENLSKTVERYPKLKTSKESVIGLASVPESMKFIKEASTKLVLENLLSSFKRIRSTTERYEGMVKKLSDKSQRQSFRGSANFNVKMRDREDQNIFTSQTRPYYFQTAMDQCDDLPSLSLLDNDPLNEDDSENSNSYEKKYSDPSRIYSQWIKSQTALIERKKRKMRKYGRSVNLLMIEEKNTRQPRKPRKVVPKRHLVKIPWDVSSERRRKQGKNEEVQVISETPNLDVIEDFVIGWRRNDEKKKKFDVMGLDEEMVVVEDGYHDEDDLSEIDDQSSDEDDRFDDHEYEIDEDFDDDAPPPPPDDDLRVFLLAHPPKINRNVAIARPVQRDIQQETIRFDVVAVLQDQLEKIRRFALDEFSEDENDFDEWYDPGEF